MASIVPPEHRNTVLVSIGAVLVAQIPSTLTALPPELRAAVILALLILILWSSRRPPPPAVPVNPSPDLEPITVPDPPHRQFSLYVA